MRSTLVAAVGLLAAWTDAAAIQRDDSTSVSGCAAVRASAAKQTSRRITVAADDALDCLKSVPLDQKRSSDFIDYVEPYLQLQSTLAYLKDPPVGWTLPGVDVLGGLSEIKHNLRSGAYKNQWSFEKDLYMLVNIFPHDFHFNLPMPLVMLFNFQPFGLGPLVSVSEDGLALPKLYLKNDLDLYNTNSHGWSPSPLVQVNGEDATDYVNSMAQTTCQYQDPDAIFNQALTSVAYTFLEDQNGGNLFQNGGGYLYGFTNEYYNYTFANGTTRKVKNIATTSYNFDELDISTGEDLFNAIELPPSEANVTLTKRSDDLSPTPVRRAASTTSASAITSLIGYPSPVVIHPDGYTSGYFLTNSTTAVLVVNAFEDPAQADRNDGLKQLQTVAAFLAACKKANKKNIIIDVQGNGGGEVFSGYDLFKQFFPTTDPFGASRYRIDPFTQYMGVLFSAADEYNRTFDGSEFEEQSYVDVNGQDFTGWSDAAPEEIYGDKFTAEFRYNLTEISEEGVDISGYGDDSVASQYFAAENIVILTDGTCGSTCAIFSELMKSQGGVRSIAVGGRPQYGPMQGVAGSKGAEVLSYHDLNLQASLIPAAIDIFKAKGLSVPETPSSEFYPQINNDEAPLGQNSIQSFRFNFRNNMHIGDKSFTPLQFIYEAANCKLFYTLDDLYDISGLWERVDDVVWHGGKCVEGSSVMGDRTMPKGAYDTVAFGPGAYSTVVQAPSPGLLEQCNGTLSQAARFFLRLGWAVAK